MVTERIKRIMKEKHITNQELAAHLKMSSQSLANKFSRDSFSVEDLVTILDFLNCQLVIESKPDTKIILSLETKEG